MERSQTAMIDDDKPLAIIMFQAEPELVNELHAGDRCPACGVGQVDYDGMLNLVCGACGYTLSGCFT